MNTQNPHVEFTTAAKDYEIMARALAYLGDRWQEQVDYKAAAQHVGLSASHFHKIFTRWAGVSPKQYVGALTQNAAAKILDMGGTVEDASFEVGLSAPSRLHDLFIRHVALSPGEAKSRAANVEMVWGCAPCPFGIAVALVSQRGLSAYGFCQQGGEMAVFEDFSQRYPKAFYVRNDKIAARITTQIFNGGVVPISLYGTQFQLQVWKALLAVKSGHTVRYMDIANMIKRPKAVRAVGAAIGANPISWILPCHRILGADKRLTGYHWGVERKRTMLAYESLYRSGM